MYLYNRIYVYPHVSRSNCLFICPAVSLSDQLSIFFPSSLIIISDCFVLTPDLRGVREGLRKHPLGTMSFLLLICCCCFWVVFLLYNVVFVAVFFVVVVVLYFCCIMLFLSLCFFLIFNFFMYCCCCCC